MGERTYTQAERERMVAAIRRQLKDGKRVAVSAAELGITEGMFYRWVREAARDGRAPASAGRPGRPADEKARLVAAIRARVARGARVNDAAQAEGISDATYYTWARELADVPARPILRPVEITALVPAAPAAPALVPPQSAPLAEALALVAPGGYRIEGLSIEAAAALLRALA